MSTEHKNDGWREAVVLENMQIARGNYWIKLQALDEDEIIYQPGHVVSLSIVDSFNYLHRKPYTISKSNIQEKTFEHLYKLIPMGNFSNRLAKLRKGDKINFRGVFHNPIHEEIAEDVNEIVLISTGTGIGPIYGFAEKSLSENLFNMPITLYAGFREIYDICLKNELNSLTENYSNFKWYPTLTQPISQWNGLKGRVTESIPPLLNNLNNTHFHLVGNGKMVYELMDSLKNIGVPSNHISKETYFNHGHKAEPSKIEEISKRFKVNYI